MARTKPSPTFVVADLDTADKALARLAEIRRIVDAETLRLNETVDKLKAHVAEVTAAPLAEASAIEAALASYAETKKDTLFSKLRSQALTFGVIGFRRSSEVKPKSKNTWGGVLERIKSLVTDADADPFRAAIRVKQDVNRDVLKDWPEERLEAVGARIVTKDTFYYELEKQEIKEVAA
ncbi:host-nuclease inhibitor Gam family protein [Fundidesulfovibrio butyratiphilus]